MHQIKLPDLLTDVAVDELPTDTLEYSSLLSALEIVSRLSPLAGTHSGIDSAIAEANRLVQDAAEAVREYVDACRADELRDRIRELCELEYGDPGPYVRVEPNYANRIKDLCAKEYGDDTDGFISSLAKALGSGTSGSS